MYAQLSTIVLDHLTPENAAEVEQAFEEHGEDGYVEIDEGDESLPQRVDASTVWTATDLIRHLREEGRSTYVVTETPAAFEGQADSSQPGYWDGTTRFMFEGN